MTYSTAQRNPYIIGRPIDEDEPELFFGRKKLYQFIEDILRQDKKVILLHGQRRIGKSSVLRHLPEFVAPDKFAFVPFDLEHYSRENLSGILDALVTEIIERLKLDLEKIRRPSTTELAADPYIFSRQFLPQVYEALVGKKLVLLLDEFDALNNENSESGVESLFLYLQSLVVIQDKLFIISFVGRQAEDMPNLLSIFKEATTLEIGLLDELSAKQLITKPAEGVLEYEPDALQAILKLSAGHPYFTQVICFALFGRARELENWKVNTEDVEGIVDKAIESAGAGLAWFWDGLSIPERVVFSAVAEAQNIAISTAQLIPEEPLTLLKNYGVIPTEPLIQAARQITAKGFLDETGRRVKVELVRRWVVQRYPLRQEIRELEKFEQEKVNCLCEKATVLRQQGKKQKVIELYEQVLTLNPNHFSVLVALAEAYLEVEDFNKAVELYTRAYQVDPIRNKEGLLRPQLRYGYNLIAQRDFARAKEQYNKVLEIEPDNVSARERLREIADEIKAFKHGGLVGKSQKSRDTPPLPVPLSVASQPTSQYKRKLILLNAIPAVVGIIVSIVVVFGVYGLLTPCPVGEQKEYGIRCVAEPSINRSRGERTLFTFTSNVNRDRGNEAFRKGNYSDAVKFFEKAVAANRSDPEVLIYYNNARARQQSSPLTLAVVVPVDNAATAAQNILRGVAQAQNQFNDANGFNGRLLEIAIANDGNEPDKAQQVAHQLVNDPLVLGVIGHNSSDASKAALGEYEKAGLATISPTSSSTWLTGDVFFRTLPSDADAGKKLAEYAKKSLGLSKVVIFFNRNSLYSNSLRENFQKNFEQLGGKLVREPIDLTNPKLKAQNEIATSLEYNAEAALLFPDPKYTFVALEIAKANVYIKANSRRMQSLKLLGGDALYSQTTLNTGGEAVESLVLAVPWFAQAPQSQDFSQAAEKLWGAQVSWLTATSFDATQAFIKALSDNPSRSTVLQRLRSVNLSPGETSGEALQFTSEGERWSKPIIVKIVRGASGSQSSEFRFEAVKEQK
jgi:ABC-type branched-subunit amino acid transport system substrate-binding protein